MTDQNILSEKSEALHSQPMLEHAKVIWLIRTFFLRNQRHCTHFLCWNMQKSIDQNILSEKSEALHSHSILEHVKVIWLIKTSFLRNQRHWTHPLCWNMQRSFDWSGHLSWEIRGTALTTYVGTCKGHLTDQNIFPEKS